MSVGANSIKRAARMANAAVEPKENMKADAPGENIPKEEVEQREEAKLKEESAPVKKGKIAKKSGKAARKPAEKEKTEKKPAKKPEQKSKNKPAKKTAAKSGYEAYGIGQQLPIHLL